MSMRSIASLLVAMYLLPAQAESDPLSLDQAYQYSLQNDPSYHAANFDYQASQQEPDIGFAGLLPQISSDSRYGKTKQITGQSVDSNSPNVRYDSSTIGLTARQVLFDKGKVATYDEAKARGKIGGASWDYASQELFTRVVEAYFDVARQENELKLTLQQKVVLEGLVKQTQRLFEAGDGTITDTEEAQARLDLVKAQEIENQARLQAALHTLSGRTGHPVEAIMAMQESLPSTPPLPADKDLKYWQLKANQAAPRLDVRRSTVELAEAQLKAQQAGHYPSLSVVSEYSKTYQENYAPDYQRQSDYYIGIAMDVPLYAGGGVTASVNRSQYALSGSMAQLDSEQEQLIEDIERDYLGVVSGYAKSKALQTAVKSNQRAMQSAEKGYQAGERSTIDILNTQQVLFAARRDLLNTKLLMLQSYVSLHAHSGQMQASILHQVQELF